MLQQMNGIVEQIICSSSSSSSSSSSGGSGCWFLLVLMMMMQYVLNGTSYDRHFASNPFRILDVIGKPGLGLRIGTLMQFLYNGIGQIKVRVLVAVATAR